MAKIKKYELYVKGCILKETFDRLRVNSKVHLNYFYGVDLSKPIETCSKIEFKSDTITIELDTPTDSEKSNYVYVKMFSVKTLRSNYIDILSTLKEYGSVFGSGNLDFHSDYYISLLNLMAFNIEDIIGSQFIFLKVNPCNINFKKVTYNNMSGDLKLISNTPTFYFMYGEDQNEFDSYFVDNKTFNTKLYHCFNSHIKDYTKYDWENHNNFISFIREGVRDLIENDRYLTNYYGLYQQTILEVYKIYEEDKKDSLMSILINILYYIRDIIKGTNEMGTDFKGLFKLLDTDLDISL